MARTAVCNRHHTVDQQLARWLLLSLDRLQSNQLLMTQELIANMLGVRREGVTNAAGKLQKLGLIAYCRGQITVLDRPKTGAPLLRVLRGGKERIGSPARGESGALELRGPRIARRANTVVDDRPESHAQLHGSAIRWPRRKAPPRAHVAGRRWPTAGNIRSMNMVRIETQGVARVWDLSWFGFIRDKKSATPTKSS